MALYVPALHAEVKKSGLRVEDVYRAYVRLWSYFEIRCFEYDLKNNDYQERETRVKGAMPLLRLF